MLNTTLSNAEFRVFLRLNLRSSVAIRLDIKPNDCYSCTRSPIIMRLITFITPIALGLLFISSPALAATAPTPATCQPVYNGGIFCNDSDSLAINKTVLRPGAAPTPEKTFNTSDFIENIGPDDPRYLPGTATAFKISVTNTSGGLLKNIVVKDIFPPRFLTFVSGSGTYDDNSRTFSTTIKELKSKETKDIIISVMTARPEDLPTDDNALCTINLAMATVTNKISQDSAQICVARQESVTSLTIPAKATQNPTITKGGLPIISPATPQTAKQTPSTGPEVAVLFGLIPAAGLGLLLRRKTA